MTEQRLTWLEGPEPEPEIGPEIGQGWHEMFSWWAFVVAVSEHTVQVVTGGGHPSWFPECGTVRNIPRAEFGKFVRWADLSPFRYRVAGWSVRAEGLTVAQLEARTRERGHR